MRSVLGMALVALMSTTAQAGDLRDPVMDLLNAFEDVAEEADLKALGAGVDAELMEIADDDDVPLSRRGRAVTALHYYKTAKVHTFLDGHLSNEAMTSIIRRKAAWSLGTGWGTESVDDLSPFLSDKDVQLRLAVVEALGAVGGADAHAALKTRRTKEDNDTVNAAIDKALGN